MDPEAWQLLVTAFGGAVLLFSAMFAMMQYVVRSAIKPLERRIDREAEHVRDQFAGVRTQFEGVQAQFGDVRTQFVSVQDQFGDVRTQFASVQDQFADVRTQFAKQNDKIDDLGREMRAAFAAQDAKFDRVLDGLRDLGERVSRLEGAQGLPPPERAEVVS